MGWIILFSILAVAVVFALNFLDSQTSGKKDSSKKSTEEISYRLTSGLFTPTERKFYNVLCQTVSPELTVFGKVRVADVITPASASRSQWQAAFNRIQAKHFDYVICDRKTLLVKAVIELQDKSHQKPSRSKRDQFLRKACIEASLLLLEFPAKARYEPEEIRALVSTIPT